jgi:hypothetical protein
LGFARREISCRHGQAGRRGSSSAPRARFIPSSSRSSSSREIIPEFLTDAPEQVADLLTRMWPIDIAYYPTGVHAALTETLHIASL